jgi:hypothetical protein
LVPLTPALLLLSTLSTPITTRIPPPFILASITLLLGTLVGNVVHDADVFTVSLTAPLACTNRNYVDYPTNEHLSITTEVKDPFFTRDPSLLQNPDKQRSGKSQKLFFVLLAIHSMLGGGGLDIDNHVFA